MADKLKHLDQEAFGRIVGDVLDKTAFRHDSAVRRGIDEFKEFLGDLHFDDEKKASMFASFMAQVIQSTIMPTINMAAQMVEADARLEIEKDVREAEIKKIDEERKLIEIQRDSATYEYTFMLPIKKSMMEAQRDRELAETERTAEDKLRITADKLRIEAQTQSIVDQNNYDKDLKAAEIALRQSQKLSEDKKNEINGLLDMQKQLLASQAAAFDVNKTLKGADAIGQVMGMLVTNDVPPAAGMVSAHRKLIQTATGVDISEYTSVK